MVGLPGVLTPAWPAGRADRLGRDRRQREEREAVNTDLLDVARLGRDHHVGDLMGEPAAEPPRTWGCSAQTRQHSRAGSRLPALECSDQPLLAMMSLA